MEEDKQNSGLMEYDPESKQMITEQPEPEPEFKENPKLFSWLVFSIVLLMLIAVFFFVWNIMSLAISRKAGGASVNFSPEGLIAAFVMLGRAALVVVPVILVAVFIFYFVSKLKK